MLLKTYRRRQWRRHLRFILLLLLPVPFLDLFLILGRHHAFKQNLLAQTITSREALPYTVQQQKIFITAQFWSSESLLNNHWIDAFLRLVDVLGSQNVYVSILSNHGLDNTEDSLRRLDAQLGELGVLRTIDLDPATHEDIISVGPEDQSGNPRSGWVVTQDTGSLDSKERRRIPYLAELRNRALEPLQYLRQNSSRTFDRILYLNDVVFEPKDILTLLATRGGDFDVACGLDYHLPPNLYDTFAARDIAFRGPITSVFPYFGTPATHDAILAGLPAPVKSCWNGVIAVNASPYYDKPLPGQLNQIQRGLRFRAIPDTLAAYYLEASECCLIHADLLRSGQVNRGMYINPAVRTAYVVEAYNATHWGSKNSNFVSMWQYWSGIWVIRWRRWVWSWVQDAVSISAGQNMPEVLRRVKIWEREGAEIEDQQPRTEVGVYCTILEMQILIWNGWKHVKNDIHRLKIRGRDR